MLATATGIATAVGAVVEPAKYECDYKNLTCTFA